MKQFLIKLFCLASASLFSIIPAKFAFGFAGAAPTGGLSFFLLLPELLVLELELLVLTLAGVL